MNLDSNQKWKSSVREEATGGVPGHGRISSWVESEAGSGCSPLTATSRGGRVTEGASPHDGGATPTL